MQRRVRCPRCGTPRHSGMLRKARRPATREDRYAVYNPKGFKAGHYDDSDSGIERHKDNVGKTIIIMIMKKE